MLMWMVLTLAMTAAPQSPGPQPAAESRAQAEQLARSGSYRAALERFQAMAAANPDDIEARVWIARLHAWMGDDERAAGVYQSILATQPQHVEALVGLGDALVRQGRRTEAGDILNRAEKLAPENPGLLAAQGRVHRAAGRETLGLAYYERSLAIDPAAAAVRAEYNALRRAHAHRVELGYFFEHFNQEDTQDPQAGTGGVNLRVAENLRVAGVVQYERKFSLSEARGGGGIEWNITPAVQLRGGALIGDDGLILPKVDGYGGIDYTRGRATWSFDVRFAEFEGVDVQIGGGGLRLALPRDSTAWIKYYRFSSEYSDDDADIVHSWAFGAAGRPGPGWTVGAEYTRGPDQLEMLTIDRTGAFETNTYSGFIELLLTPMFSAHARYDYQDRPEDIRVHRATFKVIHRF